MIKLKDLYSFRLKIRKLYDNEVYLGDLSGNILNIFNTSRECSLESVQIMLSEYHVSFVLKEYSDEFVSFLKGQMLHTISTFVKDNINYLDIPLSEMESFYNFINSASLIDVFVVGNKVDFYL